MILKNLKDKQKLQVVVILALISQMQVSNMSVHFKFKEKNTKVHNLNFYILQCLEIQLSDIFS